MKKIGVFGGTFDPPHFGHIHLALGLKEAHHLDEVWWIPVQVSPFKQAQKPLSPLHRVEMLGLALESLPYFKVKDIEAASPGPSYTVDTLRKLKIAHPEAVLYLLMGQDAAAHFEYWKEPEEILKLASPLVGTRENVDRGTLSFSSLAVEKALREGLTLLPNLEISATTIRNRLKSSLYCGHLVPAKVLDYIERHHLYSL